MSKVMNMTDVLESPLAGVICEKPFYDAVFINSPTGIALTDSTGMLIDANEACAHILGYPRSELVGKTFQEITFHDDILYDMQMFNNLLKGEGDNYEMTKRFVQKGGGIVWARIKVNAVREDGTLTHLIKHVIKKEDVDGAKPQLVGDIIRDPRVRAYLRLAFGLLTFSALSSILTFLHVFGVVNFH